MKQCVITLVALIWISALPLTSPGTGIPVIDYSNLVQNVMTALKQVAAYAQQVQQYQLQLQQYANQVKNTVAPVAQVWQAAQGTMNSVMGTVSMFQGGGARYRVTSINFRMLIIGLARPIELQRVSDGRKRGAETGQ